MTTPPGAGDSMNAWLAAIVAASSDAIISCTVDAVILSWNPAAERMFGYTSAEAIGRPFTIIVPPDRIPEVSDRFARLRAGEVIRDVQTIRMRKDGAPVPVSLNFAPVLAGDGTVTGVSVTACDLTERRRAEAQFKALLDSAPDPIFGVDADGRIVFASRQTEAVLGYAPAELVGQPIEVLVPERLRPGHERQRSTYLGAPTTRPMGAGLDLSARRRDGTEVPVEISLSPLTEAVGPAVVAILRDVSERRLMEEEHARQRTEVDRLKDDLSNMIVHDLKNPVNGIFMTVQAMLRRTGEVSHRQRKSLTTIEQTCQEMLRLAQNLLEIAKLEAGKLVVAREAVDVTAVVEQVAREYGPLAAQVGKRLVVALGTGLPFATADLALMKRVLVNLVVNAIRHSGATEVRIESQAERDVGELTIHVRDNGHGIPAEDHERIFEKFGAVRRSPSGQTGTDTGLGLPFCKLALGQMGGRIELVSAPGATEFRVTVPVHAAHA
jgi:protein-histidine pros-kinase